MQIIKQKIINQSDALSILGLAGAEAVAQYANTVTRSNVDTNESLAAKEYLSHYHDGLNRRVDDLIEPYRAIVDLVVHNNIGSNLFLSKKERREIPRVLHIACMIDDLKVNVMTAIEIMIESLKHIVLCNSDEPLKLPLILPIEDKEGLTE